MANDSKSTPGMIFKWLVIGFLGTFAIICVTLVVVIWRFTPLIAVDDETHHVKLLGGLIDLNGLEGQIMVNGKKVDLFDNDDDKTKKVSGNQTIDTSRIHSIQIPFKDGKINLSASADKSIHWDCKFDGAHGSGQLLERPGAVMMFDFGRNSEIKCDIKLPKNLKSHLEGSNGKIEIEEPTSDVEVSLTNGKVSIEPKEGVLYHYDLSVKSGVVAEFESSNDPHAVKIKMKLENGVISKE